MHETGERYLAFRDDDVTGDNRIDTAWPPAGDVK